MAFLQKAVVAIQELEILTQSLHSDLLLKAFFSCWICVMVSSANALPSELKC